MSVPAGKHCPAEAPDLGVLPAGIAAGSWSGEIRRLARVLLKGFALIAVLALLGWGLNGLDVGQGMNQAWVDRHVRAHGLNGVLWFAAASALGTAVGLPRQAFAFLGGYAYGWFWGGVLATFGTLGGAAMSFAFARAARRLVRGWRLAARTPALITRLAAQPFGTVLMVRLMPVGNNLVTNLAAGALGLPLGAFLAASAIGYLPQSLIFALLGQGVQLASSLRVAISVVMFVAASLLGMRLYRRLGKLSYKPAA